MSDSSHHRNRRILVIDDNRAIHDDFRKILAANCTGPSALEAFESALFGADSLNNILPRFEIDSAYQGLEGFERVKQARSEHRPYAMAFIDVRMPPGWDGIETTARIWEVCPDLQIVICTAYSDYTLEGILEKLGHSDRLVILKKPFDNVEAVQLANALTAKWNLAKQAQCRLEDLERSHIQSVLERTRWVIEGEKGAARILGLNPSTLRGRLRKLGIRKTS